MEFACSGDSLPIAIVSIFQKCVTQIVKVIISCFDDFHGNSVRDAVFHEGNFVILTIILFDCLL